MTITEYKCDIKNCKKNVSEERKQKSFQVIFITNQSDGRHADPYFDVLKLDICNECLKVALSGGAIYAAGAMGHNSYWFKEK